MNITPMPDHGCSRDVANWLAKVGWENRPKVFDVDGKLFAYVSTRDWSLVTPIARPAREEFVRMRGGDLLNSSGNLVPTVVAYAIDAYVRGIEKPRQKPWYLTTGARDLEWENQP